MLLAEELALVAINPDSGHHALGDRDQLNACLAGLLVAEVGLDDAPSDSPVLAAAAEVLAEKGPKIKPVLSHMSRGLDQRLGVGTWDAVIGGLVDAGVVTAEVGTLRTRYTIVDPAARDAVVERLRVATAGDHPLDARTAMVLSMTGPAQLLEVVAPERRSRKHARRRIDGALDSTALEPVGESVRRVLADAAAAVAVAATVASLGAASS